MVKTRKWSMIGHSWSQFIIHFCHQWANHPLHQASRIIYHPPIDGTESMVTKTPLIKAALHAGAAYPQWCSLGEAAALWIQTAGLRSPGVGPSPVAGFLRVDSIGFIGSTNQQLMSSIHQPASIPVITSDHDQITGLPCNQATLNQQNTSVLGYINYV